MTQEYTPVAWQDETTSQQGTLINAERLNQMQQAHHYADGLEEVDAIPTADPGVSYHKIVYCTADSTIYRWDGTEWTKDIDDETKALLQQEIARATAAEGGLAQDIADEATARETADTAMQADISALESGKLDKKTASPNQWQVYGIRGSSQIMINAGLGGHHVPLYGTEEDLLAKMPTLGLTDNTVVNYGWATAQIGAEATARAEADTALGGRIDTEQARAEAAEQANAQAIANTYTKAEIDTALGAKADVATTYTKTETDTLLGAKADTATTLAGYGITDAYTKTETDTLLALKADQATTYTKTEVQTYVSNALDSYLPMVRTTGSQIISGTKKFNNGIIAPYTENIWCGYPPSDAWRKIATIPYNSDIYIKFEIFNTLANYATGVLVGHATVAMDVARISGNISGSIALAYENQTYTVYIKASTRNYMVRLYDCNRFRVGYEMTLHPDSTDYNVQTLPGVNAEVSLS